MQDNVKLAESIRAQFPLVFGDKGLISAAEFYDVYNAVADYSIKNAEPSLKPETLKHQWTLAGTSIGLVALILFKVGKVKVGEATVTVDSNVLIWFGIFLATLLVVFLLRAFLDVKRAGLARKKDSEKLYSLSNLVQMAWLKYDVQHYFWQELFHQIGQRYEPYRRARSSKADDAPFEHIDIRSIRLDLDAFRKHKEFAEEIKLHEAFIRTLIQELDSDVERFESGVLEYDNSVRITPSEAGEFNWDRFSAITQLFDSHLKSWFEARRGLSGITLNVALEKRFMRERKMFDAQLALLKTAQGIRRMYTFTEIVLPTSLAIVALAYVWLTFYPSSV